MRRTAALLLVSLTIATVVCTQVFAELPSGTQLAPKTPLKAGSSLTPPVVVNPACSDIAVQLTVGKPGVIVGGSASLGIAGNVCNKGLGDYNGPEPVVVGLWVNTYDPALQTAASVGNQKIFSTSIAKLAKGECKAIQQSYPLANVVSIGQEAPSAGQRQQSTHFLLEVQKGSGAFTQKEDCTNANNTVETAPILWIQTTTK
jgi:hypothetical protein